jgi:hypothetical protein
MRCIHIELDTLAVFAGEAPIPCAICQRWVDKTGTCLTQQEALARYPNSTQVRATWLGPPPPMSRGRRMEERGRRISAAGTSIDNFGKAIIGVVVWGVIAFVAVVLILHYVHI